MAGLTGKSTSVNGATILSWNSVPAATGYHAWAMGAKVDQGGGEPRDFVWWSSSASREFGGGLWDWISPAVVQRLISQKIVMPPSQTSCAIPAEVKQYAPDFLMGNLYAYGPEANFSYPPKPANAAPGWTPDWTARVRYRSFTSWMIGGPMGGMGASGIGRRHGTAGLLKYTESQTVAVQKLVRIAPQFGMDDEQWGHFMAWSLAAMKKMGMS